MRLTNCHPSRSPLTFDYHVHHIPLSGDNQGSIFIASNPVTEPRSKHIDIRYHYIREVHEKGIVDVFYIDGNDNPADIFTKNLGVVKFLKFRSQLGLHFQESRAPTLLAYPSGYLARGSVEQATPTGALHSPQWQ